MRRRDVLTSLLAVLTALPANAWAHRWVRPRRAPVGSWRLIGRAEAGFAADHDRIIVAGPHDDFRALKFRVTDAGLNLQRMVVTYDNGEVDRLDVRQDIPQGGESRAIDLRGGSRSLRRVDFWYDTKGLLHGRADVTLFGRK